MREAWVWFLGRDCPVEKETATQASILAWKVLWTEEPGGLQSMGSQGVRHNWATEHCSKPEAAFLKPYSPWVCRRVIQDLATERWQLKYKKRHNRPWFHMSDDFSTVTFICVTVPQNKKLSVFLPVVCHSTSSGWVQGPSPSSVLLHILPAASLPANQWEIFPELRGFHTASLAPWWLSSN